MALSVNRHGHLWNRWKQQNEEEKIFNSFRSIEESSLGANMAQPIVNRQLPIFSPSLIQNAYVQFSLSSKLDLRLDIINEPYRVAQSTTVAKQTQHKLNLIPLKVI